MIWNPGTIELHQRISEVFSEWVGTPYMRDQLCKHVACDCVTFAYGFYCDLFGFDYKNFLPSLPKFSPKRKGNSDITMKIIRIFKDRFSMVESKDDLVYPGDLIAVRIKRGLGHVFIVGSKKNILYHCDYEVGVTQSGFSMMNSQPYILRSRKLWD